MEKVTQINLPHSIYGKKIEMRERLATGYKPEMIREIFKESALIKTMSFPQIDAALKAGKQLSFEQAFVGMCYAIAATNILFYLEFLPDFQAANRGDFCPEKALAKGVSFLQAISMKEALDRLYPQEIAGMVAASNADTLVRITYAPHVVETCGMGGDRGFWSGDGRQLKTINASTLSSIVLAACGIPVIKHGSFGNTTKIGSTNAMESFGVKVDQGSADAIKEIYRRCGYHFSDAHLVKTLHDLSHLLNHETVNHILGPMTPPISNRTQLSKVMGVNHNVHPEDIALAFQILHERNILNVGNVLVVTGLDSRLSDIDPYNRAQVKNSAFLDELAPGSSIMAVVKRGKYIGSFVLRMEDIDVSIDPNRIKFENDEQTLIAANLAALKGEDQVLTDYLAANAALGHFCMDGMAEMNSVDPQHGINTALFRKSFLACRDAIQSGAAFTKLQEIAKVTQEVG